MKDDRHGLGTTSIKTATLFSFVVFALFMLAVLWGISTFFMGTYYERARSQEVMRTAEVLETQFRQNKSDFYTIAVQTAGSNDIYLRVDTPNGNLIFDGTNIVNDAGGFEEDIEDISEKLRASDKSNVTETVPGQNPGSSRLLYATMINSGGEINTLYIVAPLHPDPSTIRILRNMLTYVSVIVLFVSLLLAYMLSLRISTPIENLTGAAMELSKGNYDVKFDGSVFTETKALAKALNTASYEMEKTDFYQREILANVSHDLKTPLTMIRSYAEKIIDITGDNPEKRNADLNTIISETERLNKLVGDLLSISNLQSDNIELHVETFDISEAARDVYESYNVLSSSKGFKIEFDPCRPCYVVGDRTRLMQVMNNFVDNAVKYSGDEKYINIKLVRSSKKVAFHCIDRGIGIPSDEIGHVWDKYYRTSANHERSIEGTGLGLAIVKGILNLHSANFGVESSEGKGSDFWFELDTVKKPGKNPRNTVELDKREIEEKGNVKEN